MNFNQTLLLLFVLMISACAHLESGRYVKSKNGVWEFVPDSKSLHRVPAQDERREKENTTFNDDEEADRSQLGASLDPTKQGRFLWPVPSSRKVSSSYGARNGRAHEGIDIAAPLGSYILAIDDGVVIYSGQELGGYGNITVLAHRGGYFSVYAHAMKNYTRKGQKVYRGQVIALVGMTGRSTGPHLHFEIRKNSEAFDPEEYLAKKSF